jgi:hypothetical protein
LFWFGVIEATRPELCPSFFQVDLAPAILRFLGRDDTSSGSPLDPSTLESLRRDDTAPLTPEILGVLSDDTSSPSAREILGASRHGDTRPSIYLPSSSDSSGSMSPTAQLTETTRHHQNIAPAMPGLKPLPSRFAMQRGSRPFARGRGNRAYASVLYNFSVE